VIVSRTPMDKEQLDRTLQFTLLVYIMNIQDPKPFHFVNIESLFEFAFMCTPVVAVFPFVDQTFPFIAQFVQKAVCRCCVHGNGASLSAKRCRAKPKGPAGEVSCAGGWALAPTAAIHGLVTSGPLVVKMPLRDGVILCCFQVNQRLRI